MTSLDERENQRLSGVISEWNGLFTRPDFSSKTRVLKADSSPQPTNLITVGITLMTKTVLRSSAVTMQAMSHNAVYFTSSATQHTKDHQSVIALPSCILPLSHLLSSTPTSSPLLFSTIYISECYLYSCL